MNVMRQQIEKKKVFGQSNAQDFKFRFVINSVQIHFEQYGNKARQAF
jgi:hypothetical protein